ncbi:RNA polymerase sigma factor SigX [Oceanobacillus polygoni]|uniref:RNA polymerase sigma-70 factor (ECF subfamily) n=1 Tax=Oceanobacillus polygoni TaxID=1235259 RepID=A0A9X0YTL1_9BACI|nr:RNA polymerase sigma factor SigX [Oceanobacillus polygoni]MBP2077826.1 RNA polymerase sigma-70 factor (ECF subfamily) [Oceanobacillus polygoni]
MKTVFDKFYDSYHQDLFQYVFYMVKDIETAEDLVQEIYIKVLKSYDNFKGESSEKTWLFSIARHVTYDYFRSLKRKRNRILEFFDWNEKGELIPDKNELPEEIAEKNDQIKRVYTYLNHCTLDQRNVIILRYLQSFSIQETAEILNFTVSKVKTTQHRALKTLRKAILEDNMKGGDANEKQ